MTLSGPWTAELNTATAMARLAGGTALVCASGMGEHLGQAPAVAVPRRVRGGCVTPGVFFEEEN
jgi:hypothetical protein